MYPKKYTNISAPNGKTEVMRAFAFFFLDTMKAQKERFDLIASPPNYTAAQKKCK
jgi:hypothetical protein